MTSTIDKAWEWDNSPCLCEPGSEESGWREHRCEYCIEIENQIWKEMIGRWSQHGVSSGSGGVEIDEPSSGIREDPGGGHVPRLR